MKVLVLDDDAETRILMSDYLARLDVAHVIVSTAGECLARLVSKPHEFSLLLLDIHMPAVSGPDLSTWIKASECDPPRGIPIIALTGDETFHDEDRVAQFGMSGVLSKPVTLASLMDLLRKHSLRTRLH